MKSKPQIDNIWIDGRYRINKTLRLDWDNERHHEIVIVSNDVEGVANTLRQAALFIENDMGE